MFYIQDVVEVGNVSHSSIGRRSGFVTLDVVDVNDAYPNSDLGDLLRITIDSIPTEEVKAQSKLAFCPARLFGQVQDSARLWRASCVPKPGKEEPNRLRF